MSQSKNQEPEGFYPEYRQEFTRKIASLASKGESFKIVSKPGMGKSKYFRYITSSAKVYEKFFKEENLFFVYIDLNRLDSFDSEHLLNLILGKKGDTKVTVNDFEKHVEETLKKYKRFHVIFDQAGLIAAFPSDALRMLRSVRDNFKYKLGYIFVMDEADNLGEWFTKYLLEVAPVAIEFPKLSDEDIAKNTEMLFAEGNIKIKQDEKDLIVKSANGYGKFVKMVYSFVVSGESVESAIEKAHKVVYETAGKNTNDDDFIESMADKEKDMFFEVQKKLTRNEFLFFTALFKKFGGIVSRDELAELISPESKGEGVSNQAVDQIISRLRKKLEKGNFSYTIKNRHGVGYYMVEK